MVRRRQPLYIEGRSSSIQKEPYPLNRGFDSLEGGGIAVLANWLLGGQQQPHHSGDGHAGANLEGDLVSGTKDEESAIEHVKINGAAVGITCLSSLR